MALFPSFEEGNALEYDLGKCMHVYHGLLLFFDENNRLITLGKYLDSDDGNLNKVCEILSLYFDKDKNLL